MLARLQQFNQSRSHATAIHTFTAAASPFAISATSAASSAT